MPVQFAQTYTADQVKAIATHHLLHGEPRLLPNSGMVNEAWLIGDAVIRIIRDAENDDEAERESWVVPLVGSGGVPTPELLAADLSKTLVARPYTIYRRAKGVLLAALDGEPASYKELYRELGRTVSQIGRIQVDEHLRKRLRSSSPLDAKLQLQRSYDAGAVDSDDLPLVENLIEDLINLGSFPAESRFLHRDIHPWNFFIHPDAASLECIIDWGDAAWGEPAVEFASMPLVALQPMLNGYAESGGKVDRSLVARSLLIGLALALWEVRGLDPEIFARQWWRCPPGGWHEELRWHQRLLDTV